MITIEAGETQTIDTIVGVVEGVITEETTTTEMILILELIELECRGTIVMIGRLMETEVHILRQKSVNTIDIWTKTVQKIQFEVPDESRKEVKTVDITPHITRIVMVVKATKWI